MRSLISCWLLIVFVGLALAGCQAIEEPGEPYPDPQRFERAISRFEAGDKRAMPPTGAVLCVGSSSIRLWHSEIADDLAPLTVIPRGFGGSNMNDLLHYADRVVLAYRPRAVLIYEGDNDIAQGVSPRRVAKTFERLVEVIHAELPDCRIYMLAVKPSPARWDRWPQMLQANRLLQRVCAGDGRLTYIDIATPMLGEDGRPRPDLFVDDQLHLNRTGYAVWRSAIRPVLVEAERPHEPAINRSGTD